MTTKLPFALAQGVDTKLGIETLHIPPPRQAGGSALTLDENGRRFRQALTIFGLPDKKETLDRKLTFDEAARELGDVFDLNDARRAAVHQQTLWGLAESMQTQTKEGYAALFNGVHFTEKGIQIVRALLEQGHDMVPIFNPGLSLVNAYEALIGGSGVEHWTEKNPTLMALNSARKISPDPRDLEGIEAFHTEVQMAELIKAHWMAGPFIARPSVTFTPLETEPTLTSRTAIQLLQHQVQTIDSVSDWILWRMLIDARFSGETTQTPEAYRAARDQFLQTRRQDEPLPGDMISVYPDHVLSDGGILAFTCGGRDSIAKIVSYCPDDACKFMGSRIAIR